MKAFMACARSLRCSRCLRSFSSLALEMHFQPANNLCTNSAVVEALYLRISLAR